MSVRQTCCAKCGQDIEGMWPYRRGEWRDRGNNTTCPNEYGDKGQAHTPHERRKVQIQGYGYYGLDRRESA